MKVELKPPVSLATHKSAPGEVEANFATLRPTLARIAYRMLGSVADAEDVVQEAFVRWMRVDRARVLEPKAFLRRMVTNLSDR